MKKVLWLSEFKIEKDKLAINQKQKIKLKPKIKFKKPKIKLFEFRRKNQRFVKNIRFYEKSFKQKEGK